MAILITGGAGYIGSHAAKHFLSKGEEVIVYDNLSTGFRQAVSGRFIQGDLCQTDLLTTVLLENNIDAVIHFAAKSQVKESTIDPELYYHNNVGGTLSLLRAMLTAKVERIVFSSTAAVYGDVKTLPITEDMPTNPKSVYGRSKLMIEQILRDFDAAYGIRSICLRYFNVAGAEPSGAIGEAHNPESHIIPLVLQHILQPTKPFDLYGNDYDTPDGTCIRDYIAIGDLVDAHDLALQALRAGHATKSYNLGSGTGFSNQEVISAAERVTGKKVQIHTVARRSGDPARLVASSDAFCNEMGWKPQKDNLEQIILSAWKWHSEHPNGYITNTSI